MEVGRGGRRTKKEEESESLENWFERRGRKVFISVKRRKSASPCASDEA